MGSLNETPVIFSLPRIEYPDEGNSEQVSPYFSDSKMQENETFDEAQPSCSGLHLQTKSSSRTKSQETQKPPFPWKTLLPKRGISKLIFQVVASAEKRTGVSLQALKKSVVATGYDLEKRKNYFKRVLRALVAKGLLRKLTGHGLTGSYAISKMMMKVLKRRKRRRRRRRRKRKRQKQVIVNLKTKKAAKRRKRRRRKRSRRKKNKSKNSDSSGLCSQMPMTSSFHN
ncbi:uncharacterized protein LOC110079196 [Pogona vitticeps]